MQISISNQDKIVRQLQWDDDRYSKFVYECGIAYLYAYIKDEAQEIIDQITRSKVFWAWWKRMWDERDQRFLETIGETNKNLSRQLYQNLHDPATLAAELYPNGVVLGETYAHMIHDLTKEVAHA